MKAIRIGVLILAMAAAGLASHHHRSHEQASGQAGQFDFYLFVLSWSPEFCYSHPSAAECGSQKGFIVHGLWPQNSDGTWPHNCATNQPAPSNPESVSDIMPAELVAHEWQTHGTCSGLSGDQYLALIRKLYQSVKMPAELEHPSHSQTSTASRMKQAFEGTNPQLSDDKMAVQVRGNYLLGMEFCLSKDASPAPIACQGVHDTRGGTFVVPPVK